MRRFVVLAGTALLPFLSACGWIEESKAAARKEARELLVVEDAERGDLDRLKSHLSKDPTLANSFRRTSSGGRNSRLLRTDTALTASLKTRQLPVVELLLSSGADPNLALDSGDVPLDVLALAQQRDETAVALGKLLVARGARLSPRPREKTEGAATPLQTLVSAGAVKDDQDGLLRLYASDASAFGVTNFRGLTVLHDAAWTCQDGAVEVLLDAGADPNVRTVPSRDAWSTQRTGDTPLHRAMDCARLNVVFALCAGGTNPYLKNEAGETPLETLQRITRADRTRFDTRADPRRLESVVAALSPDGPCGTWHGRFLREGRPASWQAVRVARLEHGCAFDSRSDCDDTGWAYHKGEGVPVDPAKAMAAYRKACGLNGAWACGMVGILHDDGAGVAEDPAEAARWFARGCDGNDGQSCFRLAGLARDGRGLAQDRGRALALFEKACAQKYEKGCQGARALR